MRVQRASNGQILTLTESALLGAGGEARIYTLPEEPSLVAKIWHKPTPERAAKLAAMLANPPVDPMAAQSHISIAWPTDALHCLDRNHTVAGFLMPYVQGLQPMINFFNPKTRREKCPLFNYFYLHRTARNLAIAVRALHERGYVIGDLNESNVLVSETALVTIVDTDSFQVWDGVNGKIYRCRVGKPEFTPAEMQGKKFGEVNREPAQDLFGLAVLIFEMLMEGTHPFAGAFKGSGEAPPYEQRISAGHFPYGTRTVPYGTKPIAPRFTVLHPAIQQLFIRAFEDGHEYPSIRPDTQSWQYALEEAENTLVSCWVNPQHVYSAHEIACPWCERTKVLGGRDPFPSVEAVRNLDHLKKARPPKTRPPAPVTVEPPLPRRIPNSQPNSGSKPKKRGFAQLTHNRNDWAWLAFVSAIVAYPIGWFAAPLGFLVAIAAVVMGVQGEVESRSWMVDGGGRYPARIGLSLGLIASVWFYLRSHSVG
jgi:DNA-binding helix-hairpin-helix protein with protein kinase domain